MRVYADSSFILRLVTGEAGSEQAVAEYRRLDLPRLFYLPLHALEVENAIRQRAFHERRIRPAGARRTIKRERETALSRLEQFLKRGILVEVVVDTDAAQERARALSGDHTDRLGARAIDLLHVACALLLDSEVFLTSDRRQSGLARAEGLQVSESW